MSIYPSTISYQNPVTWDIRYKTLISKFDEEGAENRKQKWSYPKRDITLNYQGASKSDMQTIWEFYIARGGAYGSFSFFESTGAGTNRSYTSEYVGTGDSTTLTFSLPAKDSSGSHMLLIDGTSVESTDYSFTAAGGSDGEDSIVFAATSNGGSGPPGTSARITYTFNGRLKVRCRFAEDNLNYSEMFDRLANTGIKLKGLLNS